MFDQIPPRKVGMLAAQHLGRSLEDNPMDTAPLPDGTQAESRNHPWRQWRDGFADTRILLHKQNRTLLAAGIGLLPLWRIARSHTKEALINLGQANGELLCIAILAAMLEAEETHYDLDDPHTVMAIYSAMKLRMTGRPPGCHHEPSWEIHNRAHNVAGALLILFTAPKDGQVSLNIAAMAGLMDRLAQLEAATRDSIAKGEFSHLDN